MKQESKDRGKERPRVVRRKEKKEKMRHLCPHHPKLLGGELLLGLVSVRQ